MIPLAILALEAIGSDSSLTVGLVVTLCAALAGALTAAVKSRVTHAAAISEHAKKIDAHAQSIRSLEDWRLATQAAEDAIEKSSASTVRGTKPYPR